MLLSQLEVARQGEEVILDKPKVTIGNSKNGGLSLDFLSEESNRKLDKFGNQIEQKIETAVQSDPKPLLQQTLAKMPQLMFVLLPLFAVILKIMFLFSKRLYMEHLTVALHSHSFIFLTILTIEILNAIQQAIHVSSPMLIDTISSLTLILLLWIPIYLFIMQKKVYKQGYILTSLKFAFMSISVQANVEMTIM